MGFRVQVKKGPDWVKRVTDLGLRVLGCFHGGSIYTESMELSPQNHTKDSLLRPSGYRSFIPLLVCEGCFALGLTVSPLPGFRGDRNPTYPTLFFIQ